MSQIDMAIYKLKKFTKWQLDYKVKDSQLLEIIEEINKSPKNGSLGKFLYKKRIGNESSGKRSGHRVIVAAKIEQNYFFMYGFQKNEKDNLEKKELKIFKELAKDYVTYSPHQLKIAIKAGELEQLQEHKNEQNIKRDD